jgi:WD40 repeat protein
MTRFCCLAALALAGASEAAAPPGRGRDWYGDPLPAGALARCGTARFRPGDRCTFVLSPDGKRLATAEHDKVRLWDARTGRQVREIDLGRTFQTFTLRFTADGLHLVLHADDRQDEHLLAVIEVDRGRLVPIEPGKKNSYDDPSIGGKRLAALQGKRFEAWTAVVWDLPTVKELFRVEGATAVACSPDGKSAATGHKDGSVKLWRLPAGKAITTLAGHKNAVNQLAFSPDGKALASADWPTVRDGGTPDETQTVRLWDVVAHEQRHVWGLAGHPDLTFSPDSRHLAITAADVLTVRHVKSGKARARLGSGEVGLLRATAFSPDGRLLAWSAGDVVRLFDLDLGRTRARWTGDAGLLFFSADGRELWGSPVGPWEVPSGRPLRRVEAHEAEVRQIGFTANGRQVVSLDASGELRLWSRLNGAPLPLPEASEVVCWRAAADGRSLAAVGADGAARVWELPSRRLASFEVASRASVRRGEQRRRVGEDALGIAFDPAGAGGGRGGWGGVCVGPDVGAVRLEARRGGAALGAAGLLA